MNIEFNSVEDLVNTIEGAFAIIDKMKDEGLTKKIESTFTEVLKATMGAVAEANVEAYNIYRSAGISEMGALMIISEDSEKIMKAFTKKALN